MGIFSTKKKHFVDTQVQRVIEDDMVGDPTLKVMVETIFKPKSDISTDLLNSALHGAHRQFESYYNYAADPNGYIHGLPDLKLQTSNDGVALAEAEIQSHAGAGVPITIEYLHFRPLNNEHMALRHLTDNLGYSYSTGEINSLSAPNGANVYLEKLVSVHETGPGQEPEDTAIGAINGDAAASPSPINATWATPQDLRNLVIRSEIRIGTTEVESVEIHTIWDILDASGSYVLDASNNRTFGRNIIVLNLTAYDTDREYYQAKYIITATAAWVYWIYDTESGSNTALNEIFDIPSSMSPGTYFPFAVFRSEGTNRATAALASTNEYITTEKLLSKLGVEYQVMADAMHQDSEIDNVDQAVMMMAIPINSTNDIDVEYLYRFFEDLYTKLPATATDPNVFSSNIAGFSNSPFGGYGGTQISHSLNFSDADFEMALSYGSILRTYHAGQIGDGSIGNVENVSTVITNGTSTQFNNSSTIMAGAVGGQNRFIRMQLNEHMFCQFQVRSPRVRYRIYRNKSAEGGAEDDKLLIPLDRDICQFMSPFDREVLYQRSLHMVYNSHVVQKIRWYESGFFKAVLMVIGIVLIAMGNPLGKFAIAVEAGIQAVIVFVIQEIIIGIVLKAMAFKFLFVQLAKVIGGELLLFIAAIAAIAGIYLDVKDISTFLKLTAKDMLFLSNSMVSATQEFISDEYADLISEYDAFFEQADELWKEIEEANKDLNSFLGLNPDLFIGLQPAFVEGETPEGYFNRTIHQNNPGTESLKLIENYVSMSLLLPDDRIAMEQN